MLSWDKSFALTHKDMERKSKQPGKTKLTKYYPYSEPSNPELGGWHGRFDSLELCIALAIDKAADNSCLLRRDGAFVWSERTLAKVGEDEEKRLRFILQMMQFFYSLMMGQDAIYDGIPFRQYLGPLK
jgi:hypothetical protein